MAPPASNKPVLTKHRLAPQGQQAQGQLGCHRHLTSQGGSRGAVPPPKPWESPGGQGAPGTPSSVAAMAGTGLTRAGDLLPNAAQAPAHCAGACCREAQLPRQEPGQQQGRPGTGRGRGPGGPGTTAGWGGASTRSAVPLGRPPQPDGTPSSAGGRRAPLSETFAVLLGAAGGGETASILTLCRSHKAPLWRRRRLSTEERAFRFERAGGRSHGARREAAPVQVPEQHPITARSELGSLHPPPPHSVR